MLVTAELEMPCLMSFFLYRGPEGKKHNFIPVGYNRPSAFGCRGVDIHIVSL